MKTTVKSVGRKTVREILMQEWDPVDVRDVPEASSEYDVYVDAILQMVLAGASQAKLSDHLLSIEADSMGLPGDERRSDRVAASLLRALA